MDFLADTEVESLTPPSYVNIYRSVISFLLF